MTRPVDRTRVWTPVVLQGFAAHLKPIHLEVLLIHSDGKPYPVIAAQLNIPVGTVRSRLHRGRAAVVAIMEKQSWQSTRSPLSAIQAAAAPRR